MDSPYLIFGLLVVITGFFLAIAMSIQFCACVKAYRRIQREKVRLKEIQEAAAQPPPPYALVVSTCHVNSSNPNEHHQRLPHSGGNICCVIGTISQYQGSPVMSPQSPGASSTFTSTNNCSCSSINTTCYTNPNNFILAEGKDFNHIYKSVVDDIESPPTYEDALKIENEIGR